MHVSPAVDEGVDAASTTRKTPTRSPSTIHPRRESGSTSPGRSSGAKRAAESDGWMHECRSKSDGCTSASQTGTGATRRLLILHQHPRRPPATRASSNPVRGCSEVTYILWGLGPQNSVCMRIDRKHASSSAAIVRLAVIAELAAHPCLKPG